MTRDSTDPPLHDLDPTGRFSDRAEDYVRYRPTYPAAAVACLLREMDDARTLRGTGDQGSILAADLGAGTGISSRLLAERGVRVLAIEPNAAMRAAGSPHPLIEWRAGTGEATGLDAGSVELVMCAQAFHWFRQREAIAESHRILRPGGRLCIMWNSRDGHDPLTRGYIEAIHAVNGEDPAERRSFEPEVVSAAGLFTPARLETFDHTQVLDRAGLVGRAISASYVPREGARFRRLVELLDELFERHRDENGRVVMRYVTKVYLAERT
ncbi:MAG: class I SAM-dependent methyltransferase [Candidatus Eisenbacteria bacterium]|nr:class I SAM-dependent methyltransferase [Candidatus Eisenbacteria bacterium]